MYSDNDTCGETTATGRSSPGAGHVAGQGRSTALARSPWWHPRAEDIDRLSRRERAAGGAILLASSGPVAAGISAESPLRTAASTPSHCVPRPRRPLLAAPRLAPRRSHRRCGVISVVCVPRPRRPLLAAPRLAPRRSHRRCGVISVVCVPRPRRPLLPPLLGWRLRSLSIGAAARRYSVVCVRPATCRARCWPLLGWRLVARIGAAGSSRSCAFPGHAGRCWPLLGWRLVARTRCGSRRLWNGDRNTDSASNGMRSRVRRGENRFMVGWR